MTFDQAQSPRLGQRTPVESTYVRMFSGSELPEASWTGQIIYRNETQSLQVFNGNAWENVTGGTVGTLTFVGATPPTSQSAGDIWFDSANGNLTYRAAVAGATTIGPGQWENLTVVIPPGFKTYRQDTPPAGAHEGDLWYETDNSNHPYVLVTGVWVSVQDATIAAAQASADAAAAAAALAQSTAAAKVTTFLQTLPPTSISVGDIWYDIDDNNKMYRAAAVGATVVSAGEWELVASDPTVPSTAPPFSPVVLRVTGTNTSLVIQTSAVSLGTTQEIHVYTTSGYVPTPADTTTMVVDTSSQVTVIERLPNGTNLDPSQVYYVRTYAHNIFGYAPAPSAEISGSLDLSNLDALITARLVAGFILTGLIQVGQMSIDANEGITINAPGGGPILHFPVNGDPLSITAQIVAQTLNVQDDLEINGTGRIYGDVALSNGISDPVTSPTLISYWPEFNTIIGDGSISQKNMVRGLIEKPGSTTDLAYAAVNPGSLVRGISDTSQISYMKKIDGTPNGGLSGSWGASFYPYGGLTYLPSTSSYYLLGQDNNRLADYYIYRINATTGAKISETRVGNYNSFGGLYPGLTIDGTSLAMLWVGSTGSLTLRRYNGSSFNQVGGDITLLVGVGSSWRDIGGVVYDAAGTGTGKIWVSVYTGNTFDQVMPFSPTSSYALVSGSFDRATSYWGMCYDNTGGQFMGYGVAGKMHLHGKYLADTSIQTKQAWYDGNATGGTHETMPGPTKTTVLKSRAYANITATPPPDANNVDPLNIDKADQVMVYASDDAGLTWHPFTNTVSPWSTTVPTLVGLATGTPQIVNGFTTSANAALGVVHSTSSDTLGSLIRLEGDGSFRIGSYTDTRHFGARVKNTAATQAITTGLLTLVSYGSDKETPTGLTWDAANNKFVVTKPGVYQAVASIRWTTNATGRRNVQIWKNGVVYVNNEQSAAAFAVSTATSFVSSSIPMLVGDSVEVHCFQDSGATLNLIQDDARTYFSCAFLGQ